MHLYKWEDLSYERNERLGEFFLLKAFLFFTGGKPIVFSRNNKYIERTKENNKQKNKKRIEALKSKIKENEKNYIDNTSEMTDRNEPDYKTLYREVKKEFEKYKKIQKREIESIKNSLKKKDNINEQVDGFKLELYKKNEELKKALEEVAHLNKKEEEYVELLNYKASTMRLREVETSKLKERIELLKTQMSSLEHSNLDLRKNNKYLKEENKKEYEEEIHNLKENLGTLQKRHKTLQNQYSIMKERVGMFENTCPDSLLRDLYDKLTPDNFYEYKFVQALNRKFILTKRKFYSKRETGKDQYINVLYGYIHKKKGEEKFIGLDKEEYNLSGIQSLGTNNGDPVSVIIDEDSLAKVYWRYETPSEMKEDVTYEKKKLAQKSTGNRQIPNNFPHQYIGDYSVAIVTSLNGKKYQDRLIKHGLNAIWVDAYEKNPIHVKDIMESCDVVILCVDSMPHSVNDNVDRSSDKYQFMSVHNDQLVVNRVIFALNQLQLKIGEN